jgi:hypothetical protein
VTSEPSERPQRTPLPDDDPRTKLARNVADAIDALPYHFSSSINIEGLEATDLFSLNTLLGGAIEIQTVETLNRLRSVWDPGDEWQQYGFERVPQSFPDVRLVRQSDRSAPAIGVELKGWYLLSKEAEPSFRFRAAETACTPWDLIAVVPWSLSNVLSGTPRAHAPFVEQAAYAARMRNYYWEIERNTDDARRGVEHPPAAFPYAPAGVATADVPEHDGGGNFGRLARNGELMESWQTQALETPLAGIAARHWIGFLGAFTESKDAAKLDAKIERLFKTALMQQKRLNEEGAIEMVRLLGEVTAIFERGGQ